MYYTIAPCDEANETNVILGKVLAKHNSLMTAKSKAESVAKLENKPVIIIACGVRLKKGDLFYNNIRHTYYGIVHPRTVIKPYSGIVAHNAKYIKTCST